MFKNSKVTVIMNLKWAANYVLSHGTVQHVEKDKCVKQLCGGQEL